MSLDIYLEGPEVPGTCRCSGCGHEHTIFRRDYCWSVNITHNLNQMAMEAGLYEVMWRPEEHGYKYARDVVALLRRGLETLCAAPDKFKALNPDNGWGRYENLVQVVKEYIEACESYQDAAIVVSR